MWKSLSIIAICMSLVTNSFAQKKVNLDLICFSPDNVTKILENFKEEYVFAGIDELHKVPNLTTVLFLNKETKTYSLMFNVNDKGIVCIISAGTEGKLLQ